ncbi:hypothetical protein CGLO_18218 [Colletotrichum gloeosporioides Cg-14]|uniref:Uncharacterized protein n=1 Tax=Colletotrichum gloeosporioides (strain Cg-14) TaxID=1237896 RepID=T0L4K0_COLGC|nr:hypothetical protein CGLO_18218 [Colletotrichum gloeosporioides Cg-14]
MYNREKLRRISELEMIWRF